MDTTRATRLLLAVAVAAVLAFTTVAASAGTATPPKRPRIVAPATVKVEATGPRGAIVRYRKAKVLGAVKVVYSKRSGTRFKLGTTVVRITAKNRAGVVARAKFKVRVVDTTPPVIAQPADAGAEASSPGGAAVRYAVPKAVDRVSGPVAAVCSPASGGTFPLGTTTVTCTARDRAYNRATATFAVKVVDTTPPLFADAQDRSAVATSSSGREFSFSPPTATDAATASPAVTCSPSPGSFFPVGTTPVTCTTVDGSGNKAATTFQVTVTPMPAVPGSYSGQTSQSKSITFRVSDDGQQMNDLSIPFATECSGPLGQSRLTATFTSQSASIGADGTVSVTSTPPMSGQVTGSATVHFKATFAPSSSSASGTFDVSVDLGVSVDRCSPTGTITWTASRTG